MKKLERNEMKNLLGGRHEASGSSGCCDYQWTDYKGKKHTTTGSCAKDTAGHCYCSNGVGSGCGA
jgi:hypothetical protein